jgi:hypothetical protein
VARVYKLVEFLGDAEERGDADAGDDGGGLADEYPEPALQL